MNDLPTAAAAARSDATPVASSDASSPVPPAAPSADAPLSTAGTVAMLPVRDAAARMFLLSRLIATFDEGDQTVLAQLLGCGCTPDLIDRLRGMTAVDALRFTAEQCGLTLGVDSAALQRQLRTMERRRADRETYEYLIRAGASPALLCRLFSVATSEVRRLRKLIAPGLVTGGRPKLIDEDTGSAVVRMWQQISAREPSERQRYVLLHKAFEGAHLVGTLEAVLAGHHKRVPSAAGMSGAAGLRPGTAPAPQPA